tara:strand:- start:668 stop:1012 length:345 start_codon:yes stop_codon:yes gene_type:complete
MKISGTTLMVNVENNLEIGPLKVKTIHQVCLYEKTDGAIGHDIDLIDYTDVTYMGVKIDSNYKNWTKFCTFHKEMGIDFEERIREEADNVINQQSIGLLVAEMLPDTLGDILLK